MISRQYYDLGISHYQQQYRVLLANGLHANYDGDHGPCSIVNDEDEDDDYGGGRE